jgi:hypothetical protein
MTTRRTKGRQGRKNRDSQHASTIKSAGENVLDGPKLSTASGTLSTVVLRLQTVHFEAP